MRISKKHEIKKHEIKRISRLKRHKYTHIIPKLHYKRKISYKTLYYMKEYGPHSDIPSVIFGQSFKILLLASILSSIGGIHLQTIGTQIVTIIPLLILLPALNDMIGDFGTVVSSKFTTLLFLGKVPTRWWNSRIVQDIIFTIIAIGIIASVYIAFLAYGISLLRGFPFDLVVLINVLSISMLATIALIGIICTISIAWGIYLFQKKEDPNNFLIPITTAIGDLGSMLIFSSMVAAMF